MTWNDRLREAAYVSPTGVRVQFSYEDVSKKISKRTSGFDFPDVNGTYVQDLGQSGRKLPLRIFFSGDDYDLETDAFEAALLERGSGRLEHPIYGVIDVVPFGDIGRRDDLVTAANQSIIEVTFWETLGSAYPAVEIDTKGIVIGSIEEFNQSASEQFEADIDLTEVARTAAFKEYYGRLTDTIQAGLTGVTTATKQLDAIKSSLDTGIDELVSDPITLALQTLALIQVPGQIVDSISAQLDAYGNLISDTLDTGPYVEDVANPYGPLSSNNFHTALLSTCGYVSAQAFIL